MRQALFGKHGLLVSAFALTVALAIPAAAHEAALTPELARTRDGLVRFKDAPTGIFADFNPNLKCPE